MRTLLDFVVIYFAWFYLGCRRTLEEGTAQRAVLSWRDFVCHKQIYALSRGTNIYETNRPRYGGELVE